MDKDAVKLEYINTSKLVYKPTCISENYTKKKKKKTGYLSRSLTYLKNTKKIYQ